MASGMLDYYRGVDVAYQALSQMIVRPKYGGALLAWGSKYCTANVQNTLVGIAGKGMIYGGAVWLDYTLPQANSQVWLGIDGYTITNLSFERLLLYGINQPRSWPVSLLHADHVNRIYAVGISYGITFETQVVLAYYEQNGFTPTVHYRLVYALI